MQNETSFAFSQRTVNIKVRRLHSVVASLLLCALNVGAISPAVAASSFVLLSASTNAPGGPALAQQLANWREQGLVSDALLLAEDSNTEAAWEQLGLLEFADEAALQHWQKVGQPEVGAGVIVTVADALAHLEETPRNSTDSVFIVTQYDVAVPLDQFQSYIDGYQIPEMVERIDENIMDRYSSYYARSGSDAPWQSLVVMEYRDSDALAISDDIKKQIGERLRANDPVFKKYSEIKESIRTKTSTTQSLWVELPQTDQ